MSLTKKILSNTFWQIFGRFCTALIGIVSIKIITNYLPTEIYGQYTTLYELIGFFAIAADFGLYTIGVREMAKKEKSETEILANILTIRLLLIILTSTLAIIITNLIPQYQNTFIAQGIPLVALTTAFALLTGTLSSILQYRLKMHLANFAIITSRLIAVSYIALTVFVFHPQDIAQGFTHLLYAGVFANLALLTITLLFVKREIPISLKPNKAYLKELTLKSLPYGLALILSTLYFKLDIILLGLITDYHQVGIYGVPLKLMEILSVLPIFLLNSALPAITQHFHSSLEKFQNSINRLFKLLTILATPLLIGGVLLAFPLTFVISSPQFLSGHHCTNNLQIVYQNRAEAQINCPQAPLNQGFQWHDLSTSSVYLYGSDIALKIILLAMFFSFLNSLFAFSLVAIDQQSKLITTNALGVTFNLISNLIVIPLYGFIGAAITTVFSEIIILIGTFYYLRKFTHLSLQFTTFFKTLLAGLIMGLPLYYLAPFTYQFLQNKNILILIPLGATTYALALYFLKIITPYEIKKLLTKSR